MRPVLDILMDPVHLGPCGEYLPLTGMYFLWKMNKIQALAIKTFALD